MYTSKFKKNSQKWNAALGLGPGRGDSKGPCALKKGAFVEFV